VQRVFEKRSLKGGKNMMDSRLTQSLDSQLFFNVVRERHSIRSYNPEIKVMDCPSHQQLWNLVLY